MSLKVEKFDYNSEDELLSNTYVVSDESQNCIIIDPSKKYLGVVNFIKKNNLNPIFILLTHGHFDHFGGVEILKNEFPDLKIYIHFEDEELLTRTDLNCSNFGVDTVYTGQVSTLKDNDLLYFGNEEIKVVHTPFHTEGSVCYYLENNKILFTGDTLFKRGIGRYDLATSDHRKVLSSLQKLSQLPKDLKIYPGHGPNGILGDELDYIMNI